MITVATRNMRFYFRIVKELKRRGLPFKSIVPSQPVPAGTSVILTTSQERPTIGFEMVVGVGIRQSPQYGVDKALCLMFRKERFDELIVGIDWGSNMGLAAKGDGVVLRTSVIRDLPRLEKELKYIFRTFPSRRAIVRIGRSSSRKALSDLIGLASNIKKNVRVEVVDERRTSRMAKTAKEGKRLPHDVVSALYIASRRGMATKESCDVRRGEVSSQNKLKASAFFPGSFRHARASTGG